MSHIWVHLTVVCAAHLMEQTSFDGVPARAGAGMLFASYVKCCEVSVRNAVNKEPW